METAKKRGPDGVPAAAVPQGANGAPAGGGIAGAKKPLKPHECRNHLRKTVAGAYREIVAGFVEEAKNGGCQHLKMATEVVESKKRAKKAARGKGPVEELLEELGREFPG